MTKENFRQIKEEEHWRRAPELPVDVFRVLNKPNRAINPIAIVATAESDGTPHTAPFGSLRAITPQLIRFACGNYHDTYANLCHDKRVSVVLLAPPSIAVSIKGRARVVKEKMKISERLVAIEIDVEEVKNDMMQRGEIESGIGFVPPSDRKSYYVGIIAEIEDM